MPLRRMMEGRNFDSKSAAILVEAFNEKIDELDLRTIADREKAAKNVVELAASKTALDVAEAPRRSRRPDAKGRRNAWSYGSAGNQAEPGDAGRTIFRSAWRPTRRSPRLRRRPRRSRLRSTSGAVGAPVPLAPRCSVGRRVSCFDL